MGESGQTHAAGEGVSDDEFSQQVAEQTSSDLKEADVFKRESNGTSTDVEAAKATADDLDDDRS
jgi:hypothetical protein